MDIYGIYELVSFFVYILSLCTYSFNFLCSFDTTTTTDLQPPQHIFHNLSRSGLAAQVGSDNTSRKGGINSSINLGRSQLQIHKLQHNTNAAHRGDGVCLVLSHNVGGTSVHRLTDRESLADIGTGDQAQGTQQAGALVGQDIAVQVGCDHDVVVLGLLDQLEGHRVHDLLLHPDVGGDLGQGLARSSAEQAVRLREDVGLVDDGHHGALVDTARAGVAHLLPPLGDLAGHGGDAVARTAGDTLDRLGGGSAAGSVGSGVLLLDVQVLGVLTHDNHVDQLLAEQARGDALDGADVGVEVELLAKGDDGRGVALNGLGGRLYGAEQRTVAFCLEGVDGLLREGSTGLFEGLETGFEVDKGELEAQRSRQGFEEAATGRNDFLADAVTRDKT